MLLIAFVVRLLETMKRFDFGGGCGLEIEIATNVVHDIDVGNSSSFSNAANCISTNCEFIALMRNASVSSVVIRACGDGSSRSRGGLAGGFLDVFVLFKS